MRKEFTYKKFNIYCVALLLVFVILNLAIWMLFTKELLLGHTGDLTRLGYIPVKRGLEIQDQSRLFARHLEISEYLSSSEGRVPVDVITIGDSFSNGGGGSYYQDYLALRGLKVLNIPTLPGGDAVDTILLLTNSGYLDILKPKHIVIESVEREAISRYAKPESRKWDQTKEIKELEDVMLKSYPVYPPQPGFINTGNLKFLTNNIRYKLSKKQFGQVYRAELNKPLFTDEKDSKLLLFLSDDVKLIASTNDTAIGGVNQTFNRLAEELGRRNVEVHLMIAVDKYNLYSPYIKNNQFPESVFFEKMRLENKNYEFIDTKQILSEQLNNGTKDIYSLGDTHWSWKGASIVAQSIILD